MTNEETEELNNLVHMIFYGDWYNSEQHIRQYVILYNKSYDIHYTSLVKLKTMLTRIIKREIIDYIKIYKKSEKFREAVFNTLLLISFPNENANDLFSLSEKEKLSYLYLIGDTHNEKP